MAAFALAMLIALFAASTVDGKSLVFQSLYPARPVQQPEQQKTKVKTPPNFGDFYSASGEIRLPYTEINEPFNAYFDRTSKKSRVDYYNGVVITLQRPDLFDNGVSYKIAPMTNDKVMNQQTCFQINGTVTNPTEVQDVFPDTSNMQLIGSETVHGYICDKWQNVSKVGTKTNTYTFYVTQQSPVMPVRYEMFGYDSLMGSHYDKYFVEYYAFNNKVKPDASVFEVPSQVLPCGGFPGPGQSLNRVLMNPMREFIHNDHSLHVDHEFESYKLKHKRDYGSTEEHQQRKTVFSHNLRYINTKNRQGLSYKLAVNHLTDRTPEELQALLGYRSSRAGAVKSSDITTTTANSKQAKSVVNDVPEQFDWRLYGAVTPVKDQAICGSCWSFGTTGTIEGALFLKTGVLQSLSQQQLIDCSWGEGNNGCDGGEDFRAYDWIMKHNGLAGEADYGGYLGQDTLCNTNVTRAVRLSGYKNMTNVSADDLKTAIVEKGPISVAIDAGHLSFAFYANGVYYEPQCGNKPENLDHAVLAVGYGTLQGEPYWLIKNSWSTYYGNDGYVLMSQKDNNCGVLTAPSYSIIAD